MFRISLIFGLLIQPPFREALPRNLVRLKEKEIGRSRYKYFSDYTGPYFLTGTTIRWIAVFGIPEIAQILIDSLRFLIDHARIELHGFVIMEHHLHLIASGEALSKEISVFKSFTACKIIDFLKKNQFEDLLSLLKLFKKRHKTAQDHQVWEEGSHPQLITRSEMLIQKLNYIHNNPVRSGYVDDPLHWRYSSYRYYYEGECVLPITVVD